MPAPKKTSTKKKPAPTKKTAKTTNAGAAKSAQVVTALSDMGKPVSQLRYRELVDRVSVRTGMRKQELRPVIDAALELIAEAITNERDIILPPLGRLKVQRSKDVNENRITILKLRQKKKLSTQS